MTPEQAKKLMTVMQWIVDGKEVESSLLRTGVWKLLEEGEDVLMCRKYRLKPREPLEFWLNIGAHHGGFVAAMGFPSKELAKSMASGGVIKTAKFREVMDEDDSPTREDDSDG